MGYLFDNLFRTHWKTKELMRADIEQAGFDILNEDEFKIDVMDRAESDNVTETFEVVQEVYNGEDAWTINEK